MRGYPAVVARLCDFLGEILIPNAEFWRKGIVENKWIKEVRLFCDSERTLDVVLEPDSDWARDWNCFPQIDYKAVDKKRTFTVCLGLNLRSWQGHVVIGSVEGPSLQLGESAAA